MSDPVSALNGATYQGFAMVEEMGPQGMITLRGDLAAKPVREAVKKVCGVAIPGQRGYATKGAKAVAWMSPDELLIRVPHGEADAAVAALGQALGDTHALVVNVSDARAMFRVSGAAARDVIAKVMPVDMDIFAAGEIRRSRLAQVAAAIWMNGEDVEIVCFRSVAQYVFDVLKVSAAPGSQVHAR